MVPQSLQSSCDHRKLHLPVMITLPPVAVEKHCDKPLSVCLQKPHIQTSQNFLHMLHVAVARSSTDDSAIHYVLLVLCMMLCCGNYEFK